MAFFLARARQLTHVGLFRFLIKPAKHRVEFSQVNGQNLFSGNHDEPTGGLGFSRAIQACLDFFGGQTMQNEQSAILNQCLAYEVLRSPEDWLGAPCPNALKAFLMGADDRAGFTHAYLPEWRITGPLDQPAFYTPLVEATGHPTLSIRWATALELIHFSITDAITDLRDRVEAWAVDFDPSSSQPLHFSPPAGSVRDLLGRMVARPGLYLGRNSSWLLFCYLNGLDRGGDWLELPPLPVAREILSDLQARSAAHYGSPFGAFRVYENSQAELLKWVGIPQTPPTVA